MNLYQLLFTLCSVLVVPIWLLMIFAPRWHNTLKWMQSLWIVVPFMLAYAILEVPNAAGALPLFLRPQLPGVMALLGTQAGAALGWLHFIAADLFVGRWVYLDSRQNNMNVWLMGPILFLTSMFCPAGFVVYLLARALFVSKPRPAASG